VGTTGESSTVTVDEHCQIVKFAVDTVSGRVPIIAGTGGNSTAEAIELTSSAKALGADACLLVTPYYNKPTQEGLFRHYEAIAHAVDLPQFLYNVPGRTACDMLPETVARLAEVPQVIGIKEATGDLKRGQQIRELCDIPIYSGDDATSCDLAPAKLSAMAVAAVNGDAETSKAIDEELQGLHEKLFLESNPIPVKWALSQMGRIEAGIRLPMTPFSEKYHVELRAAMHHAGVIN
jgi:4-hydroxy-tetrahydrodipicolinate synthase